MKPYYEDDLVTLYLGEFWDFSAELEHANADAIVTDPPYGETSLAWDRWPSDWPLNVTRFADAMWCFGSMRMFMDNLEQFRAWKFSHEIVWEKHNGSGFATDKFRRVHELAALWYQGSWSNIRHETPTTADATKRTRRSKSRPPHMGIISGATSYETEDGGPRLMRSVLKVSSEHGTAVHPTQKPLAIVSPLIEYSVPVGGLVVDPFAGSGTTLLAAKLIGRSAIGVEVNEAYCEAAARRLSQQSFDLEALV